MSDGCARTQVGGRGAGGPHKYNMFNTFCLWCHEPSPRQQELNVLLAAAKAELLAPLERFALWLSKKLGGSRG